MNTILQGLPRVIGYIDDLLITSADDAEHASVQFGEGLTEVTGLWPTHQESKVQLHAHQCRISGTPY